MKYRKKPVIIDAWQLTEQWIQQQHTVNPEDFKPKATRNGIEMKAFARGENGEPGGVEMLDSYIFHATDKIYFVVKKDGITVFIKTLEGDHKANIGDFIITGVKGEQYPCKPDIFEMTYDKIK